MSVAARSIAASSGSAFITMPGPPPYGVSSTVRWRSCVKSRGLTVSTVIVPASRARPTTPAVSDGLDQLGQDRDDGELHRCCLDFGQAFGRDRR